MIAGVARRHPIGHIAASTHGLGQLKLEERTFADARPVTPVIERVKSSVSTSRIAASRYSKAPAGKAA
jgi:hypothetical protein